MRRNAFLLALEQIGAGILSGSPELFSLPYRSRDSQGFSGVVVFAMSELGFLVVLPSLEFCLCHIGAGILSGSQELLSLPCRSWDS